MLLRAAADAPITDQRVAAAAFTSIVDMLSVAAPVVVAVDDVQCLDVSSQGVLAYAARRLKGRVGLLLTERTESMGDAAPWLCLSRPDGVTRCRLAPMSMGRLHEVISARLGRSLPRPAMTRIADVSGGNPFFALELARALDGHSPADAAALPATLAGAIQARIGHFDDDVLGVLLAAACVTQPTVELVSAAVSTSVEQTVELLEGPENQGIVSIDGNSVRFSHPLLARGVYNHVGPARRRRMHRTLAGLEPLPEPRARHLALAAASADRETLLALDTAAKAARTRGAPAAAAELLDLAIGLGGDTPVRRLRAADNHFKAGDIDRAQAQLQQALRQLSPGPMRAIAQMTLSGIRMYHNNFGEAAELLEQVLDQVSTNPTLLVPGHLSMAMAKLALGRLDESLWHADRAATHAEELRNPTLISQALAVGITLRCGQGLGVDEAALHRALELENINADVSPAFSARAVHALTLSWTGRLAEARMKMLAARARCVERGADTDLVWVAIHSAMIDVWSGRYADAALTAEDMTQRADQLGGTHIRVMAAIPRALIAAYAGNERETRGEVAAAVAGAASCGSPTLAAWPIMALGFLEVSLGNYAEALTTLRPLLDRVPDLPGTEIMSSSYLPDAIEAMVALGQLDEAAPLIEALEVNGDRLGRPWMLAVGARSRAMWLAARGELVAAENHAWRAIAEHEGLDMPFERARTLLVLGQLHRRQRRKLAAEAPLVEALLTFEKLGTPLWAKRARAELDRTNVSPTSDRELTPSERRAAELAATGMTNRDIAAALFISPKTVEHNLGRVYRKLGIRNRAELGRRIGRP